MMDVRRMRLDRAGNQLIDQADHRRLARQVLQPLGILFGRFVVGDHLVECRFAGIAFAGLGIEPINRGFEFDRDRDRDRDRAPDCGGSGVTGKDIERIGHR